MPVTVDLTGSEWQHFTGPPVYPYQPGRIGIHLSTGPPSAAQPYYIYRYGEGTIRFSFQVIVATPLCGGAFAVFSSGEFLIDTCPIRYAADYSFNTNIA